MAGIQGQIDALLSERRGRLRHVEAELARWGRVGEHLDQLTGALDELREHPKTPPELRGGLALPGASELRQDVAKLVELYRVVQARFGRPTITIGVGGAARVGKSTLLQSLTGLSDDQIPTGSGIPVTAVRSRIFHAPALARAVVRLHTVQSFLDEVVGRSHSQLQIAARPATLEEFRNWKYAEAAPGQVEHRRRLEDMQRSLDSYAPHLTGGERVIDDLAKLRPWVAYPTNAEITAAESAGVAPGRLHLAVRDVRIDTPFPHTTVSQLGIVDLPGLGEIDPDSEQRHVDGLRNEVDVVLVVKRPAEGMAFWGESDLGAVNLIDQARGFVQDRRDFIALVVNAGKADDPHLVASLNDDIRRQVNDGVDGRYLTVYRADATSSTSVITDLLEPLLGSLAARLPAMDQQVRDGVGAEAAALAARFRATVAEVERALRDLQHVTVAPAEDLDHRVGELRKDLAVDLTQYVEELRQLVTGDQDDEGFVAAVEGGYREVVAWIESGFGVGKEAWCRDAVRTMTADGNSATFAAAQLNHIRVEIGRRFGTLDDFFSTRLAEFWGRITAIIATSTGDLLAGLDGRAALDRLEQLLDEGAEPCPALRGAVHGITDIHLEYRTQLYPRVRAQLGDLLALEVTHPISGDREEQITVPTTAAGAETLFTFVSARARQAAHLIRKSLLAEAVAPALVIHAFAEQFEDDLIRSADAQREFRRLARSYRDRLWPGVYEGIELDDARIGKVRRAGAALVADVEGDAS